MPKGTRNLEISVGERNLTYFGGIFLIDRFYKKLNMRWYLKNSEDFFTPGCCGLSYHRGSIPGFDVFYQTCPGRKWSGKAASLLFCFTQESPGKK
jgi:hypothetical protein